MLGQGPETWRIDVARRSLQAEAARWSGLGVMRDGGKTKGLGTASRRRRRLPGDTLIEFELGLGLSDQVPVRRGLENRGLHRLLVDGLQVEVPREGVRARSVRGRCAPGP